MNTKILPVKIQIFFLATILFLAFSTVISQTPAPWSQNVSPLPDPAGFVNDYAGVLDSATKQELETKLKNFNEISNPRVEIAVAIIKTTGDRPIFDYSLAVSRGWKIGSKLDDNPSALLLVAIDDRKYFTQVSKDLEDELPDGVVGSLQRQYLVPEFKKQNYAKGISDTVDAYILTIQNKGNGNSNVAATTPGRERGSPSGVSFTGLFCCAIIILVILLIVFSRSRGGPTKGDKDKWGGGGFGGGGMSALPWIIGGILSSGSSSSGSSTDWGGSSGGGSDWGGFGGGGDFGGGGAGGDW